MKNNTQAVHLEEMMQEKNAFQKCTVLLPFATIKKSHLKKLSKDMVLLLNTEKLELIVEEGGRYIDTTIQKRKLVIGNRAKDTEYSYDSKKYKKLKIVLCDVMIASFDRGETIDMNAFDFSDLSLYAEELLVAKGALVSVDAMLAIKIDEVML